MMAAALLFVLKWLLAQPSARSRSTGTKQSRGTASRSKKQQTGGESRVALGIILAALVLGLIARAISMGLV